MALFKCYYQNLRRGIDFQRKDRLIIVSDDIIYIGGRMDFHGLYRRQNGFPRGKFMYSGGRTVFHVEEVATKISDIISDIISGVIPDYDIQEGKQRLAIRRGASA